jgi:tRNA(Leu) C34 or U34 (ribose-2'-O)-methylase TrmL
MKPHSLPAVVLHRVKYPHNLAAAIRACSCFGVETLIWTGSRFAFAEGERLPREERMKGYSDVKVVDSERPFDMLPANVNPVCIELLPNAQPMGDFVHPENACYVFGPEDGHVSQVFRRHCHSFVYIPSKHCLNLSAALNVVLYDRAAKMGLEMSPGLHEQRGVATIDVNGWESR